MIDKYEFDLPVYSFDFNADQTKIVVACGYGDEKQKMIKLWSDTKKSVIEEYIDSSQCDEEEFHDIYFMLTVPLSLGHFER
jgi:hypothetical protein